MIPKSRSLVFVIVIACFTSSVASKVSLTAKTFAEEIEKIVKDNVDMKYVDAIVYFCEKNSLDIESIPKLISKPLKERLKAEAMQLNLLKKTSHAKLPI